MSLGGREEEAVERVLLQKSILGVRAEERHRNHTMQQTSRKRFKEDSRREDGLKRLPLSGHRKQRDKGLTEALCRKYGARAQGNEWKAECGQFLVD